MIRTKALGAGAVAPAVLIGSCLVMTACGQGKIGGGQAIGSNDNRADTDDAGVNDAQVNPTLSLPNATVGTRCSSGTNQPYIVLSEGPADCQAHAEALADTSPGTDRTQALVYAALPQTTGSVTVDASVCPAGESCQTTSVTFVIDTWIEGGSASGRYTFELDGANVQGNFTASWCGYDQFIPGPRPLASDLSAVGVKVLQGTSVTIAEGGSAEVVRNAPVVESRQALVRVFVEPQVTYTARDIVGTLTLERPGQTPTVFEQTLRVTAPSADNDLGSTFNFSVEPALMTTDLQWKVSLNEVERCSALSNTEQASIPRDGSTALMGAQSMGGTFDVVLVPFRYNFDESGRLPDTSPAQLERFRALMYTQYPISELNLTVREPFDYDGEVTPRGEAGWGTLLETLWALRQSDGVPATTFYYGLITPVNDIFEFCSRGCIAGVGGVPAVNQTYPRGAVGLGFTGQNAAQTFTHEIGHTTGRDHAPCTENGTILGVDPSYPHDNARLGALGYNIETGTLLGAANYRDIMSYCDPQWVSDYTYAGIFDRLWRINNVAAFASWPNRYVRAAIVGADDVSWGHYATLASPINEPVTVRFEDADGRVILTETADRIELRHVSVAIYWIPDISPEGAVQVRLPDGQTLPL